MPDDINNLDSKDEGLKGIFGDRFHDMTVAESCTARKKPVNEKTEQNTVEDEAEYCKHSPGWLDRLKACVVWAAGFGSLNFLIFYWQLAGLMDDSIAIPSMWVCCILAGFGVGKNAFGRVR